MRLRHELHRRLALRITGENQPDRPRILRSKVIQDGKAVDVGHPKVGDDDVEGSFGEHRERRLSAASDLDVPATPMLSKQIANAFQHAQLVVDEEDVLYCRHAD